MRREEQRHIGRKETEREKNDSGNGKGNGREVNKWRINETEVRKQREGCETFL